MAEDNRDGDGAMAWGDSAGAGRPPGGIAARLAAPLARGGEILLMAGEFEAAALACRWATKADPRHLAAHQHLSALQRRKGRTADARRTLERGVRNNPVHVRTAPARPEGRVLTVLGIADGYYMVQRRSNGDYKIALRGGNFSDRNLIDKDRFATANFFIHEDNILAPGVVPDCDVIVNTIADPDREPRALRTLATFLAGRPRTPVINRPERVSRTTRDDNCRRFRDAPGILFPNTVRSGDKNPTADDIARLIEAEGLSYPVLVRETGSHTGATLRKFDTREALSREFPFTNGRELYVTQFHDCRFRDQYFRKMRVFFIDGRIYPVICHIDAEWNVHGDNRKTVMLKNQWMMDEERAFMSDCRGYLGPARHDLLGGFHKEIGLDFFGLDFTVAADGRILVYETNAVMIHKFDHARDFPYLAPHLKAISEAFGDMIAARMAAAEKAGGGS